MTTETKFDKIEESLTAELRARLAEEGWTPEEASAIRVVFDRTPLLRASNDGDPDNAAGEDPSRLTPAYGAALTLEDVLAAAVRWNARDEANREYIRQHHAGAHEALELRCPACLLAVQIGDEVVMTVPRLEAASPAIPEALCGADGCVYLPHEGSHSWESGTARSI